MEGDKQESKAFKPAEIKKHIKDFTSADPEKHKSAGSQLMKCSMTANNVDRLLQAKFDSECAKIIDNVQDSRRAAAMTCMRRMACKKVTGSVEFNEGSLKDRRDEFYKAKAERQQKLLDAARFFALDIEGKVTSSLQGEVSRYQLVGETGWVEVALACKGYLEGPAILLLDALKNFASLPRLITEHADSHTMLIHAISSGEEPEKLAGLRLASRVLSSLKEGLAEAALPPQASAWLEALRQAKIVQAVRKCIDGSATETIVVTAVQTLTDLSSHEMFLTDLGEKKVLRALGNHVLRKKIISSSIFDLLERVLTLQVAADYFTEISGHDLCIKLLGTDGVEEAVSRQMLSALHVWLTNAEIP